MINTKRRQQYLEAMEAHGWDVLLLYGHSWRKDFFRSLVNFKFFGPHAVAALDRSGDISVFVAHPWDQEFLKSSLDIPVHSAFNLSGFNTAKTAVAGMELMEAR